MPRTKKPKQEDYNIPDFRIKVGSGLSSSNIETRIIELEAFHRRIVHFVLDRTYGESDNNILCYFVDEDGNKYTSILEKEGYEKSLNKSLEFFLEKENYENCIIIKKLLTLI